MEFRGIASYHVLVLSHGCLQGFSCSAWASPGCLNSSSHITACRILEIGKCGYLQSNSLITCGYHPCPFSVSICLFTDHHRGVMSQWDNSQPGIQHSRCGLVSATNSESLFLCLLLFILMKHALEMLGKTEERWFWSYCSMIPS